MKNKFLAYFAVILAFSSFSNLASASNLVEIKQSSPNRAEFSNLKISTEDRADPSILRVGDTYYAYSTGCNGIRLSKSTNLQDWTISTANKNDKSKYTCYWAPEVFSHNGKYYMIYSAVNTSVSPKVFRTVISESDSPDGPFTNDTIISTGSVKNSIDGHIFIDDNGKAYLFFKDEKEGFNNTRSIIMGAEMNPDLKSIKEDTLREIVALEDRNLDKDSKKFWQRLLFEGPFVVKHGGVYYLTYSTGAYGNETYAVGYATAQFPLGNYTQQTVNGGSPLLHGAYPVNSVYNAANEIYGTGHHSIFKSSDNEYYIVYHSIVFENNKFKHRKITFDQLGFLDGKMFVNGPTKESQPLPSSSEISKVSSSNYSVFVNGAKVSGLSDGVNYNAESSALNVGAAPIVAAKELELDRLEIAMSKSSNIEDVWLFASRDKGFENATADIVLNDKYILRNVRLGNLRTAKIQLPNVEGGVSNIKISFSKNIRLTEVSVYKNNNPIILTKANETISDEQSNKEIIIAPSTGFGKLSMSIEVITAFILVGGGILTGIRRRL